MSRAQLISPKRDSVTHRVASQARAAQRAKQSSQDRRESQKAPLEHKEQVQLKKESLENQSASLLEDSLRLSVETEQTGAETLRTLRQQRDQLARTSDSLSEIADTLTMSERAIKSMSSFTGQISNWFKSKPKPVPAADPRATGREEGSKDTDCLKTVGNVLQDGTGLSSQRPASNRSMKADRLEQLSASVANLGMMADTMNSELALHNRMIDGINSDVKTVSARLKKQNRDLSRLG